MDKDKYYAITKKGHFIMADSLTELKKQLKSNNLQYKDVDMFVYSYSNRAASPYVSQSGQNKYYWLQYQIIDKNGYLTSYKRGNYCVKNIYPDTGTYYFIERRITFTKIDTNETITKTLTPSSKYPIYNIQQFYYSLIDAMDELNTKDQQQKIEEHNKTV